MTARDRIQQVKAVSFDGDMTLWDFQKVMRHSLGHALAELRARLPCQASVDLTIDKMIEIRNAVAAEFKGKVVNLEKIRLYAFRRTVEFAGSGDHDLADALNAIYLRHRFEDIDLYPDVLPTLDALTPRYALGLLSNGNGYPDRCGLPNRFSFVTFSQDVGVEKPDAPIFLAACGQAGCSPQELVHVGDSLESDVSGANGVGAVSVWLNRERKKNDSGISPDYEVHSLLELRSILSRNGDASNKTDAGDARQRT